MIGNKKTATKQGLLLFFILLFLLFNGCGNTKAPVPIQLPATCHVTVSRDEVVLEGTLTQQLPFCYRLLVTQPALWQGVELTLQDGQTDLSFDNMQWQLDRALPNTSPLQILVHALEQWQRQTLTLVQESAARQIFKGACNGQTYLLTVCAETQFPLCIEASEGWKITVAF